MALSALAWWLARVPATDRISGIPAAPQPAASAPAAAPVPAASTVAGSALALPGFKPGTTDCGQLNAAHARATAACAGKPAACAQDAMRAEGFDPAVVDMCRLFRPGKSPQL